MDTEESEKIKNTSSKPKEVVSRILPLIYTKDALNCCTVAGRPSTQGTLKGTKLAEVGIFAIHGN